MLRACNFAVGNPEPGSPADMMSSVFCTGYVAGITDTNAIVAALKGQAATMFCLPPSGLENEQVIRVVLKYLSEHPEQLNEPARSLAMIALRKAFPCQQ